MIAETARPCPTSFVVSRHQGALAWLASRGIAAHHIPHLDPELLSAGDIVIGTLPAHLIAEVYGRGARYLHLRLEIPGHLRGLELTPDMMDQVGADLVPIVCTIDERAWPSL